MSWTNFKFPADATPGQIFTVLAVGYVLGCIASGYYLYRVVAHKDVRLEGSGNIGARNVGRLLGTWGFITVLLLDFGKGVLAVLIARRVNPEAASAVLALLAVTAGHIWPAQLRFHGGKGVSASLGALLVVDYRLAFSFAAIALVALALMRNFTLGGLLAFVALPVVALEFHQSSAVVLGLAVLAALIVFAHRKNIEEEVARLNARRCPTPKIEPKL